MGGAGVLRPTLILGAPERVLDQQRHQSAMEQASRLSTEGLRVLAFACADNPPQNGKLDDARQPLALVVMSDQVRDDIQQTLRAFRRAACRAQGNFRG